MKHKYFLIIFVLFLFLMGCDKAKHEKITDGDVQKIKYELIKKQALNGAVLYSINLINGSNFVILQNNVFVSFPVKKKTGGYQGNLYKVEALGNKLNIQPGKKVRLNLLMPLDGWVDKSLLQLDNPSIQINGYLGEFDNKHKFSIGGDLIKK